jgi:hypothetical protein
VQHDDKWRRVYRHHWIFLQLLFHPLMHGSDDTNVFSTCLPLKWFWSQESKPMPIRVGYLRAHLARATPTASERRRRRPSIGMCVLDHQDVAAAEVTSPWTTAVTWTRYSCLCFKAGRPCYCSSEYVSMMTMRAYTGIKT